MTLEELQNEFDQLKNQHDALKDRLSGLKSDHDQFITKVRQMRGRQKEYFKYRANSDLQAARRFEREVDDMIDAELKIQKSKQQDLF